MGALIFGLVVAQRLDATGNGYDSAIGDFMGESGSRSGMILAKENLSDV